MLMKWLLLPLLAAGATPPADDAQPVQLKPLTPLEPIAEASFPETENFLFTFYGPIAQKVYSYYAAVPKVDLSYPYAPLSRTFYTKQDGLSCARRVAKYGPEAFRCNIAFHPSQADGLKRDVPPYAYEVVPGFAEGKLNRVTLKLGDGRILVDGACPRLSAGNWAQSNYPCAYTTAHDDVNDFFFPDDIYPQGIAVGWGVVVPGEE